MADNALIAQPAAAHEIARLAEAACDFAEAGTAPNTRRAYGSDVADFEAWCASVGACSLPAEPATVALYLTSRAADLAASTLARRLAAINAVHRAADLAPPSSAKLSAVWAGIRNRRGAPPAKKRGLQLEDLRKAVAKLPAGLAGQRDRAMILVGFAGVLRRSELAALELDGGDPRGVLAKFVAGGLEIHIGHAKGDQLGRGAVVAVPYGKQICAVAALQTWLKSAGIREGRVFRAVDRHGRLGGPIGDKAVAGVVKRAVKRVGFDPAQFAGHSLRRGGLTSAARRGSTGEQLMRHARHKRFETTQGYIEDGERMKSSPAGKMGL